MSGIRPDCPTRDDPPLPGPGWQRSDPYRPGAGYQLEEIDHLPPEMIARDGGCDAAALKATSHGCHASGAARRTSGRRWARIWRTEIEYLNGFVVRDGEEVGIEARANGRLVDIVEKVELGELKHDPSTILPI